MLRVLRRLTRPTSSPTGGNVPSISSFNTRGAASRLVEIGNQTHDMSSTSNFQLCRVNNYHSVGTRSSSLFPLNSIGLELPTNSICHRAFSSEDGDRNQVRLSHLNLKYMWHISIIGKYFKYKYNSHNSLIFQYSISSYSKL